MQNGECGSTGLTEVRMQNEIQHAIEVFAKGFALTRSFTFPYQAEQVGPLWLVRDAERKRAADYRREEWVAVDVVPAEVDAAARSGTRGRFCICAICPAGQSDVPLREGYKSLGYRLNTTEAFMQHRLKGIPRLPNPFPIERVLTEELSDKVTKASGKRQMLPAHLVADAPLRLYTALDDGKPIGWLKSICVESSNWVSNVHVLPRYRRRGIGKSLMAKMLRDDRAHGSQRSILLASHTGALLYDAIGYELLGRLLVFTPKKAK
jgi:GNAT superfamily N-acetyltransferase